jgi:hypothetical protein
MACASRGRAIHDALHKEKLMNVAPPPSRTYSAKPLSWMQLLAK